MENEQTQTTQQTHSKQKTILRGLVFFACLICLVVVGVFLLKKFGVWDKINSVEKLRATVEKGGIFSSLIFMVLQFLQTTILQLPAILVTMTGVLIFPKWKAFLLSYIAIMLGSLFNFWLGRKAGRKFLHWIAGEEKTNKWINLMSEGKYVFFLMMLFPMFPDDILCVVAGLTNMSFAFFVWTNLLCRAIGIGGTVLFGSGTIIPFKGWGLAVWVVIALVLAVLFYLSFKYQKNIDKWLKKIVKHQPKQTETKIQNNDTDLNNSLHN